MIKESDFEWGKRKGLWLMEIVILRDVFLGI